jgi:hypothetical protein
MARLTIDLSPDLERRLQREAEKHGQGVGDYARRVLEASLASPPEAPRASAWADLPQRAPEELDALAASQGAPLAVRFDDLIGDFWPEDESADEVVATIRRWRREGARGRRSAR